MSTPNIIRVGGTSYMKVAKLSKADGHDFPGEDGEVVGAQPQVPDESPDLDSFLTTLLQTFKSLFAANWAAGVGRGTSGTPATPPLHKAADEKDAPDPLAKAVILSQVAGLQPLKQARANLGWALRLAREGFGEKGK